MKEEDMILMLENMKKEIIEAVKTEIMESMEKNTHSARLRERNKTDKPAFRKDVDDKEILKLYNMGFSLAEIAKKEKMSYNGIWIRLRNQGINLKDKSSNSNSEEEKI